MGGKGVCHSLRHLTLPAVLGSWTLSNFRSVPCKEDKPLRPLVISSWILLALSL